MAKTTVKKWNKKYLLIPSIKGGVAKTSLLVRTDGEVIQKKVERTIYETPYEMPLDEWTETLNKAAAGLIEPSVTVRSYDGGEHSGYYESASSETIVNGWVEDLTPLELELAREMFK